MAKIERFTNTHEMLRSILFYHTVDLERCQQMGTSLPSFRDIE